MLLITHRGGWRRSGFRPLIDPAPGRGSLGPSERKLALNTDAGLRRVGLSCLWRAAVVCEMLRRRGVSAQIQLCMAREDLQTAHAEVCVAGEAIRPIPQGWVVFR